MLKKKYNAQFKNLVCRLKKNVCYCALVKKQIKNHVSKLKSYFESLIM